MHENKMHHDGKQIWKIHLKKPFVQWAEENFLSIKKLYCIYKATTHTSSKKIVRRERVNHFSHTMPEKMTEIENKNSN